MRIAIYARKSTEQEDRQVQSLEDQIKAMSDLALREGLKISEVFQEARSAKEPYARTEFDRMLNEIREGHIDGVLTWAINRLSRNELDHGQIAYLLRTGKLAFIRTIDRVYRPEDNALLLSIENGMAVAFIQDLSRNVKRGMKGKVERGWHSNKAPVGYKNDPESREIVIDPERFSLLRAGWDMILAGNCSVDAVHRKLVSMGLTVRSRKGSKPPLSRAHLYSVFRDRFYLGELRFNGETFPGKHVPMVTEDEFWAVQRLLAPRRTAVRPDRYRFAFARTMRCATCGCSVVGEVKTKHYPRSERTATYIYYHCSGSKGCPKRGLTEGILLEKVASEFENLHIPASFGEWLSGAMVDSFERSAVTTSTEVASLGRSVAGEQMRLQELTRMRMDNEITAGEYSEFRAAINGRLGEAREEEHKARTVTTGLLQAINARIEAAIQAADTAKSRTAWALGEALRVAGRGENLLNLNTFELRIDPILAKIASFEPLRKRSAKPKPGDHVPLNSIWWRLVDELRTTATDQIASNGCTDLQ